MLKYRCVVLDHDDTVVKSTVQVHYPSFRKTIKELRPHLSIDENEFMLNCFDPGFFVYMEKILGFNESEMQYQLERWLEHIEKTVPEAYEGIGAVIRRQREEGGLICVVSHSYSDMIKRDYSVHFGMLPDAVYGGEEPPEKRKPSVYPIYDIMRRFGLSNKDIAVIDDLKTGLDMAEAAGVDFICAGWSHNLTEISDYMKKKSSCYLSEVEQLKEVLFG